MRTNGTKLKKKFFDSVEAPGKRQAKRPGPLGIQWGGELFKGQNGRSLDIPALKDL
jgi:hypothetical protein